MTVIEGLSPDTAPQPSPWVQMVVIGDETVLVDERLCHAEAINNTASIIWQCLDGEATLGEIATDLAEVFGADHQRVLGDVLDLVGSLALLDFVVDADRGQPIPPDRLPADAAPAVDDGSDCAPDPLDPRAPAPDFLGVPPNH